MKAFALLALLIAAPVLAAEAAPATPGNVVREFVTNIDSTDWLLDPGWTWSGGVLTHYPVQDAGVAQQVRMPALTPGRLYRIEVGFMGRTKGGVTVSLGGVTSTPRGMEGGFPIYTVVTDPDSVLTLTATSDYDGSITGVRVVELGDELVDATGWTVPEGWSQDAGTFKHVPGSALNLTRAVDVVSGHVYRVHFSVAAPTKGSGLQGWVSLGGTRQGWFYEEGNWNYSFDIMAAASGGQLVFAVEHPGTFDGAIEAVSVREITSDSLDGPSAAIVSP